jgi:ribosomal protein L16 Arg81 hydroxylase
VQIAIADIQILNAEVEPKKVVVKKKGRSTRNSNDAEFISYLDAFGGVGLRVDWRPSFFIQYFGRETAHLIDCRTGMDMGIKKVGDLFQSFMTEKVSSRTY